MKNNIANYLQSPSTYGRSVATMVSFCTMLCIIIIALMFVMGNRAKIAKHTHQYERADGLVIHVADPWRPLPGCLYLQSEKGKVLWPLDGKNSYNMAMGALCDPSASILPAGSISLSLTPQLINANNRWRSPISADATFPINEVQRGGLQMPQGSHMELTLNARLQTRTQAITECMTGHTDACIKAGLRKDIWSQNIEGAAARMVGVIIVDINSGAIEALASSDSPCYQAEHSGQALPAQCPGPALPRSHPQPGKLDHHALAGAKPGSLVKPIMVVAFMRDPLLGPKLKQIGSASRNALLEDIKKSDSSQFLDRAYCRDLKFSQCGRLQRITKSASDLGWNVPSNELFALNKSMSHQIVDRDTPQLTPHFMQLRNQKGHWSDLPLAYDEQQALLCSTKNQWRKCQGDIANSASELIGQGNAFASPLTIAEMMKGIGRAANGYHNQLPIHLLQSVRGKLHGVPTVLLPDLMPRPLHVGRDEARLILDGMSLTHQGGTASSGCLKAYDNTDHAQGACRNLIGVAGKTGTPGFSDEIYTWKMRAEVCGEIQRQLEAPNLDEKQNRSLQLKRTRCVQSPVKWYASLLRDNPTSGSGAWTKVLVVLTERNYRNDGWIDSKDDAGSPNVAAELGFRLIKNWDDTP